jgi:hypothetical protein
VQQALPVSFHFLHGANFIVIVINQYDVFHYIRFN